MGGVRLRVLRQESKGGAMFGQQTKPRGGAAKIVSDDEQLFVTESRPGLKNTVFT